MSFDLKDKIAVVGVGSTKFSENFELSYSDMVAEACFQAFEEASVGPKDIEAAWLSTAFPMGVPIRDVLVWISLRLPVFSISLSPVYLTTVPPEELHFEKHVWGFSLELMM